MIYRTGISHNTMHAMPAQASIIGCTLRNTKKYKYICSFFLDANASLAIVASFSLTQVDKIGLVDGFSYCLLTGGEFRK